MDSFFFPNHYTIWQPPAPGRDGSDCVAVKTKTRRATAVHNLIRGLKGNRPPVPLSLSIRSPSYSADSKTARTWLKVPITWFQSSTVSAAWLWPMFQSSDISPADGWASTQWQTCSSPYSVSKIFTPLLETRPIHASHPPPVCNPFTALPPCTCTT